MSDIAYIIGNKIWELRNLKGITQEQLAEKAGLSAVMIKKVESGANNLSLPTFIHVAEALEVSPQLLLPDRTEEKTNSVKKIEALLQSKSLQEQAFMLEVIKKILECKDKYLQEELI